MPSAQPNASTSPGSGPNGSAAVTITTLARGRQESTTALAATAASAAPSTVATSLAAAWPEPSSVGRIAAASTSIQTAALWLLTGSRPACMRALYDGSGPLSG